MVPSFFGRWLLDKGVISSDALDDAVSHQEKSNQTIGQKAVSAGLVSDVQAEMINLEQQNVDQPFGEIATSQGLLTQEEVDALLESQMAGNVPIGEALVERGHLDKKTMNEELTEFEVSRTEQKELLDIDLSAEPHAEIVRVLAEHVCKMLQRIAFEKAHIQEVGHDLRQDSRIRFAFTQQVQGDPKHHVVLSVSDSLATTIASRLLMETCEHVDDTVIDAMCEFVNMTTGHAYGELSQMGYSFQARTPQQFLREYYDIDHALCTCISFDTLQGPFFLEVLYA